MNDITKARHYLKVRNSDMQHMTSFGLMLATASDRYKVIKLRQQGNKEGISLVAAEVEIALDYAVLRYMSRNNRLPGNITDAVAPGVTLERKRELAMTWMNS